MCEIAEHEVSCRASLDYPIRLGLKVLSRLILLEPVIDPFLYFILPIPIALLNFAFKFVLAALDKQEVVVREVPPFFFQFAFELSLVEGQHQRLSTGCLLQLMEGSDRSTGLSNWQ
jgi:hypothetical protein